MVWIEARLTASRSMPVVSMAPVISRKRDLRDVTLSPAVTSDHDGSFVGPENGLGRFLGGGPCQVMAFRQALGDALQDFGPDCRLLAHLIQQVQQFRRGNVATILVQGGGILGAPGHRLRRRAAAQGVYLRLAQIRVRDAHGSVLTCEKASPVSPYRSKIGELARAQIRFKINRLPGRCFSQSVRVTTRTQGKVAPWLTPRNP